MALQRQVASMEKAKYCFATNTGMAALNSVLSLLTADDHMIASEDLYGGNQQQIRELNKSFPF